MKDDLNLLIEKGLVSDSLQLCKSIYFSNKGISPSKEYKTVLNIHKFSRKLENYINEIQFNAQKSEKENRLIEAFNKKYINLSHMDTGDLSYDLVDQLRELRSKLQKFVSKTDEMLISAEKLLGKDNINETTSPLLVIEILAELYSLLESKKPTIGNSSNMSEFEQFAYIASLKIGYKENIREFSQKLAHRRWIHRSLVKKLIIPKII